MTQAELDRAVSRATGESMATVRRCGFSIIEPLPEEPISIDWDVIDAERLGLFPDRQNRSQLAAA